MQRAGTMLAERIEVIPRAVALMPREAVGGIFAVVLHGDSIAGHLGEDRCGAYGDGDGVPPDNGSLICARQAGNGKSVDKQYPGRRDKRADGAAHCQVCRLQNVDGVDFIDVRNPEAIGDCSDDDSVVREITPAGDSYLKWRRLCSRNREVV